MEIRQESVKYVRSEYLYRDSAERGEIIRTSAEPIGRDEIMSYFKDMELNKAQEDMYLNFSSHHMSRK